MTAQFPEILIMGQDDAEVYRPRPAEVCISIRSHSAPVPNISLDYRDILWLEFDDDPFPGWQERRRTMTPHQARQVVEFAFKHRYARKMVIHCMVGASRSVAVGMALRLHFAGLDRDRRVINRPVYDMVTEACRQHHADAARRAPCRCCPQHRGGALCQTAGSEHGCRCAMPPRPFFRPGTGRVG